MKFKEVQAELSVELDKIVLNRTNINNYIKSPLETIFDIGNRTIEGFEDEVSEDLRDYLRRRGIKIFTDKPFKSI